MPRLHETVDTSLPIDDAFWFIADFANAMIWDPGTVSSTRLGDAPVGVGSAFRLDVRVGSRTAPMTYRIELLEPGHRVVLTGDGEQVRARDDIAFTVLPDGGTRVDYTADLELKGWLRLLQPFLGGTFRKIGDDARTGMQRALDARAAARRAA